jgi:hypothetical protein
MPPFPCPDCGRPLGRRRQSHECVPGMTVDEFLAGQPAEWHAVYRAVLAVLHEIGDVVVDPVGVGILVKRKGTFCELRPKRAAVELSFKLTESVDHPRIRRRVKASVHRQAHFVWLTSADEVDDEIRAWLAEAWLASPA